AVDYFYMMVPDKPGEGARILGTLRKAGVNLLAYSGFPSGRGAQLDFVPADPAAFQAVARQNKWKVKGPKRAFVIDGDDRVGACWEILDKLAAAKINVTAMDAVATGVGRWGAVHGHDRHRRGELARGRGACRARARRLGCGRHPSPRGGPSRRGSTRRDRAARRGAARRRDRRDGAGFFSSPLSPRRPGAC